MTTYEESLQDRIQKEKSANKLIKIVSDLWFDKSIELILFRNTLVDKKGSEILNLHSYARDITKLPLDIFDTLFLESRDCGRSFRSLVCSKTPADEKDTPIFCGRFSEFRENSWWGQISTLLLGR